MQTLSIGVEVLVIDDDEDFRESCIEVLTHSGLRAIGVSNAPDALSYLRGAVSRPSLILLDLMMPGMSGWDFRDEQRRDPLLADIPCLVMSASGTGPANSIAETSFVSKLVSADELIAKVASRCRGREARRS